MNLPKFGVNNPVPINLLMAGFIIAGVIASFSLRKQFFPDMNFDSVSISMAFPGASPEEIEDSIAVRIENALFGIDAIDEIYTTCVEGRVSIAVSFKEGTENIDDAIDQVKRTVDRIQDLPSDVERPIVRRIEPTMPVIMVQLWGDIDKHVMKRAIRNIRDDLDSFPEMGAINVGGDIADELTVELDQDSLVEHGISINDLKPYLYPSDEEINKIGIKAFKIGSGECNNIPLLEEIVKFKKPIILSTGMNDLKSIEKSVKVIEKAKLNYALLHCKSEYPAESKGLKLDFIISNHVFCLKHLFLNE